MNSRLPPPWPRRLGHRQRLVVDALAAGVLAAVLLVTLRWHPAGPAFPVWTTAVLALLATLPVAVRRRCPTVVLGVVLVAGVLLSVERVLPVPSVVPCAPALALYCVAERLPWRRSVLTFLSTVAVAVVGGGEGAAFALMLAAGGWAVGVFVGQHRSYASWLREQAAVQAATDERLRIARELHDVVSHSMSAIAIRAGVANHVADEEPAEARHALGDIEVISRTALTELRQMLGLLRAGSGEPGAALAPVPDLGDLDQLVAEVSRSGVQVDLRITGEPRPMPPGVGLSAYRILQESLTNVVKHAGAVRAAVTLGYRPYEVWIEVVDEGRPAPTAGPPGHGLIGMRERVSLYGGQFSAGPLGDRGFRVRATIPLAKGER